MQIRQVLETCLHVADLGGSVPTHGAHGPGQVAFCIGDGEIEIWREQLRQHGVEIEAEIAWPTGGYSLYFRDPAGNSVKLATPQTWGIRERKDQSG
jgi:catechol 2,3-dioxygenase-like lactoylglutathione lyase family enzyme